MKYSNKSKLRNKGLTSAPSLSLQSVVEGASLWQELDVIQHTGPAVRKQSTVDTFSLLFFFVESPEASPSKWCLTQWWSIISVIKIIPNLEVHVPGVSRSHRAGSWGHPSQRELCWRRRVTEDEGGWVTRHGWQWELTVCKVYPHMNVSQWSPFVFANSDYTQLMSYVHSRTSGG